MKRVLLIGSAGSGKSTLAPELARKLGLPCVHLDSIFWKPGWVQPKPEEFERKLLKILKNSRWVMDGQYGRTQGLRIQYADTIIFLDFNRWVCIWRVLKRVVRYYGQTRPDMPAGCREQFDWGFLKWVWNFPNGGRLANQARLAKLKSNQKLFVLRNAAEVRQFMGALNEGKEKND